ncbi:MAG: hypothetical protein ABIH21_02210 [Patescibacteria group bacterium]
MQATLLSTDASIAYYIIDPGVMLFGALLVLFGSSVVLAFQLKDHKNYSKTLMVVQVGLLLAMTGIVIADFYSLGEPIRALGMGGDLSEKLATHRWLLFQLPMAMTLTSLIILFVYREKISEAHARDYRWFVLTSVLISFLVIVIIALESMI